VVVVQNGARTENKSLRRAGVSVVGWGLNLGHGLGLDWGLRHVSTQYVLICDPDTVVISDRFRREIMNRLERFGVCGIVISEQSQHQRYHPICVAFETRIWKSGGWSMEPADDSDKDVGWALTDTLGGLLPPAVLPRTRGGHNGAVWAESFSNTYGVARIRNIPEGGTIDGYSRERVRRYHSRWSAWADLVALGSATVEDFPEPEPYPESNITGAGT
jgi:hypothetical protein